MIKHFPLTQGILDNWVKSFGPYLDKPIDMPFSESNSMVVELNKKIHLFNFVYGTKFYLHYDKWRNELLIQNYRELYDDGSGNLSLSLLS